MEKAIIASDLYKRYKGIELDNKENGIGLWIKNLFKLTSNKAENVLALDNVSLEIEKGEIFGIYGENGAGKTTLIKVLCGLLNPDSGFLEVNGTNMNRSIKNSISYVSTNGWMGLEWQLTAKENLIMYGNIYGIKSDVLERRSNEILQLIGMYEDRNKYISQLSAGMRQKITIARGLLIDKPIMYFDEPTVSLDINSVIQFRKIVKQFTKENKKTTIITSHIPDDLSICDRIMFLYKGKVIVIGTLDDLYKPYKDKKVLTIKCINYNEAYSEQIRMIAGVQQVIVSRNESGKNYNLLKISLDDDVNLINHIIDFLLDRNVIVFNMNINTISLNEIYKQYIENLE